MRYIILMLLLTIPSVNAQTVKLDCKTQRSFDAEDYGVKGDPKTDTKQAKRGSLLHFLAEKCRQKMSQLAL